MNKSDELSKDKKIITDMIMNQRSEFAEILRAFYDDYDGSIPFIEKTIDELFHMYIKILFRIKRFSDFKTKIKILKHDEELTASDLKRCNFILRLNDDGKTITIIKNTISEHINGSYNQSK